VTGSGGDDDADGFDDLPETHLEDDDYDEFVRREFDAGGHLKEGPPVTVILVVLIILVLAIAFVWLR
jgi:hypothetical protein